MTATLPSQEDIVQRVRERMPNDVFGFEYPEYIYYLDFEHAKEFLKDGVTEDEWEPENLTRDAILEQMHDYMEFAWTKANDCRGISANRSILHYIAWIWLAGDYEFAEEIDQMYGQEYRYYGKPILERICERYGWDAKQWDDGVRTNTDY